MIIDGKQIAKELELILIDKLSKIPKKKIVFVIFKNIPAIEQFVQMKIKVGTRLGIDCEVVKFEGEINNQNARRSFK
jgi:5,10-methylene-tetrahydrofolate dehydrogenase/methenyl tetrahydrofolate cyclohydrolase